MVAFIFFTDRDPFKGGLVSITSGLGCTKRYKVERVNAKATLCKGVANSKGSELGHLIEIVPFDTLQLRL